jgi:hypothetical protein
LRPGRGRPRAYWPAHDGRRGRGTHRKGRRGLRGAAGGAGRRPRAETLGRRVYLCAFESEEGRVWLAFDDAGEPLAERRLVREAASLAAWSRWRRSPRAGATSRSSNPVLPSCARRTTRRASRRPRPRPRPSPRRCSPEPRVASGAYSGCARLRLASARAGARRERASPFAAAMQAALGSVEELAADVERNYKVALE